MKEQIEILSKKVLVLLEELYLMEKMSDERIQLEFNNSVYFPLKDLYEDVQGIQKDMREGRKILKMKASRVSPNCGCTACRQLFPKDLKI